VAYNRPPAWRYLPPTDPPPQPLQQVADAMVETLLIPGAHHLALAVPHSIHGRSPYDFAINLISASTRARSRNGTSAASWWSGT